MRVKVEGGPAVLVHGEVAGHFVGALQHLNRDELNAQLQTSLVPFPALPHDGEPLILDPPPSQQGLGGEGHVSDEVGHHMILVFDLEQKVIGHVTYLNQED